MSMLTTVKPKKNKKIANALLLAIFVLLTQLTGSRSAAQITNEQSTLQKLLPDSSKVWSPDAGKLNDLRSACWSTTTAGARACVLEFMRSQGASERAADFARSWGAYRYLRKYDIRHGIGIAVLHAPLRIHDEHELLLIDAESHMINVDNDVRISEAALMRDKGYRRIAESYPSVALHPADRSPEHPPLVEKLHGGRTRVIVEYRLTDGCRACARIGYARIAYYFNVEGGFLAQKFLGVYAQPTLRPEGTEASCDDQMSQNRD